MLYCILPINTLEATIFNKFIIIDIYRLDGDDGSSGFTLD